MNNNKNTRIAAVLSLPTEPCREPESVWLSRVQEIYDSRALHWVLKVHKARQFAVGGVQNTPVPEVAIPGRIIAKPASQPGLLWDKEPPSPAQEPA